MLSFIEEKLKLVAFVLMLVIILVLLSDELKEFSLTFLSILMAILEEIGKAIIAYKLVKGNNKGLLTGFTFGITEFLSALNAGVSIPVRLPALGLHTFTGWILDLPSSKSGKIKAVLFNIAIHCAFNLTCCNS
jgi:hypothetical protein